MVVLGQVPSQVTGCPHTGLPIRDFKHHSAVLIPPFNFIPQNCTELKEQTLVIPLDYLSYPIRAKLFQHHRCRLTLYSRKMQSIQLGPAVCLSPFELTLEQKRVDGSKGVIGLAKYQLGLRFIGQIQLNTQKIEQLLAQVSKDKLVNVELHWHNRFARWIRELQLPSRHKKNVVARVRLIEQLQFFYELLETENGLLIRDGEHPQSFEHACHEKVSHGEQESGVPRDFNVVLFGRGNIEFMEYLADQSSDASPEWVD